MKLYATTTSERNSRPAKKGGDDYISIELSQNNTPKYKITFTGNDIKISIPRYPKGQYTYSFENMLGDMIEQNFDE